MADAVCRIRLHAFGYSYVQLDVEHDKSHDVADCGSVVLVGGSAPSTSIAVDAVSGTSVMVVVGSPAVGGTSAVLGGSVDAVARPKMRLAASTSALETCRVVSSSSLDRWGDTHVVCVSAAAAAAAASLALLNFGPKVKLDDLFGDTVLAPVDDHIFKFERWVSMRLVLFLVGHDDNVAVVGCLGVFHIDRLHSATKRPPAVLPSSARPSYSV